MTEHRGRKVLLPGAFGFRHREGVVLNMSYYAFTALRELDRVAPDARWSQLEADGLAILREAHFGPSSLPPDWLLASAAGAYGPAGGWPARFSYDAARIPLNLSWAHLHEPALYAVSDMWSTASAAGSVPAWVGLEGKETAAYAVGPGVSAIIEVSAAEARNRPVRPLPSMSETTQYYQAALLLLAKMSVGDQAPAM